MKGSSSYGGNNSVLIALLEKTKHWDKDERYMATNDLCTELAKDINLDDVMEERVCTAVMKMVDDKSTDVQSVAVKCLGIVLKRVNQTQVCVIGEKLCALLIDGKGELRDIYSIGLKTLIADVPASVGTHITSKVAGRLLHGVSKSDIEGVKKECLDNLGDILKRFGQHVPAAEQSDMLEVIMKQLSHANAVVRKRAGICLSSLALVSTAELLNGLMETLLSQIKSATNEHLTQSCIQTIGIISRTVGHRLSRHIPQLVPLFVDCCGDAKAQDDDEDQQAMQNKSELRENCFPGLESFVLKCPREITPFIPLILQTAVAFAQYDPNYCGGDDEDMDMETDEFDDESDMSEEEFDQDSDSEDDSWKVRKAAVRVIHAVVNTRSDLIEEGMLFSSAQTLLSRPCAATLIKRFKEREENVRLDVIACFSSLLQRTAMAMHAKSRLSVGQSGMLVDLLMEYTKDVIKSSMDILQSVSTLPSVLKTKSAVFIMLGTFVSTVKTGVDDQVPVLFDVAVKAFQTKTQVLKLDALEFMEACLEYCTPVHTQCCLGCVVPCVVVAMQSDWSKMIVKGLSITCHMMKDMHSSGNVYDQYPSMFTAVLNRLTNNTNSDPEVREQVLATVGLIVHHLSARQAEAPMAKLLAPIVMSEVFAAIHKRFANSETTKIAALKAIAHIAQSNSPVDLTPVFATSMATDIIGNLQAHSSRVLKHSALATLDALMATTGPDMLSTNDGLLFLLVKQTAALIQEVDLHVAKLSLALCITLLRGQSAMCTSALCDEALPAAIQLSTSPLLQGSALPMLVEFFQVLASAPSSHSTTSASDIINALIARAGPGTVGGSLTTATTSTPSASRQSMRNVAECIATVVMTLPEQALQYKVVEGCDACLQNRTGNILLSLMCIGELGQTLNLENYRTQLQTGFISCFESDIEEIKGCAAAAVGSLFVHKNATSAFIPFVVDGVCNTEASNLYYYLFALREGLTLLLSRGISFDAYVDAVISSLELLCSCEDEGVRHMVAECFGVLTCLHTERILPLLAQYGDRECVKTQWTAVTALRCYTSHPSVTGGVVTMTEHDLHPFFQMLNLDSDLNVRKAALQMVNSTIHHNNHIIKPFYSSVIFPRLWEALVFKSERVVDLGPFKHKVDDGLPIRKSALTIMETVYDVDANILLSDNILDSFLRIISSNLSKEVGEIQLLVYQLLGKVCCLCPSVALSHMDVIVLALENTLNKKAAAPTSAAAEKTAESERNMELVRSVVQMSYECSSHTSLGLLLATHSKWCVHMDKMNQKDITRDLLANLKLEEFGSV